MDKIILGLLILKSRTIYEIRTKFADNLNLMYSSSTGSIQAALKKLSTQGYIECTETVENGRRKKIYLITDSGRAEFSDWVNSSFDAAQNKNPELAKLYFMGISDVTRRQKRVRELITDLEKTNLTLSALYNEGLTLKPSEQYRDLFNYQLMTVKFGRDYTVFQLEWFKNLLSDMENGII